ncbi:hypothetical protein IU469_30085 [Nocardia puris]|uniref:hypothetical protein n=1 Tax=Nocardia puris TaxID=208602 RepID=UPI001894A8A8|nr:hypothetical protein [Nocardia puris]MBF6369930.1 hypothetical protein [Nocardia puris]
MAKPTPLQTKVLRTLGEWHSLARELAEPASRSGWRGGRDRSVETTEDIDTLVSTLEALERLASAAGVPEAWVREVADSARAGLIWHPGVALPKPAVRADRATVLAGLRDDWSKLRWYTGVDAAAHRLGLHAEDPTTAESVEFVMAAMWRRSVAVARLAGVSGAEPKTLWGDTGAWVRTATADSARLDPARISAEWRSAARSPYGWDHGWEAIAAEETGIRLTRTRAFTPPARPRDLVALITTELDTAEAGAGTAIDAADLGGAARELPGNDPSPQATFSHASTPHAPITVENLENDTGTTEFVQPDDGYWL